MKKIALLTILYWIIYSTSFAQEADSMAIKSAIQEAKEFEQQRDWDKALNIYLPLVTTTKQKGLNLFYAQILQKIGINYYNKYALDSTIYWLEKLHQEDSALNFSNYDVVYSSFTYLGQSYSRKKEIINCVNTFKKSIEYAKKVEAKNAENDVFLARAYHNTGVALEDIGDLQTSLLYMDSALYDLKKSLKEPSELEAHIHSNKGSIYKKRGFFEEAILLSEKEIEMLGLLPPENVTNTDWGLAYWYLASVYAYRNASEDDHKTVLKYVKIAEDYFLEIRPDYPLLVYVYYSYAESYLQLGYFDKAKYYIDLAEKRNKELYGEDYGELGFCYLVQAKLAEKLGDLDKALLLVENEIDLYEKIKWKNINDITEAWYIKGNMLLRQGQPEKALAAHQEALKIIIPDFNPANTPEYLLENPLPEHLFNNGFLFNALQYKAESLLAIFDQKQDEAYLEEAVNCYELAYSYLSLSREEVVSLKTKADFSRNKFSIYEKGIDAAFNAYILTEDKRYLTKAAYFADLSKSNNLLDKLQKTEQEKKLNIPANLLEKERQARALLSFTEKQLYDEKRNKADSLTLAELAQEVFECQLAYEAVVDEIRREYPSYYHFSKKDKTNDLAQFIEQVPEENIYISYFSGEAHTYIFTIGKGVINGYKQVPLSEYEDVINEMLTAIRNKSPDYASYAQQLYETLLAEPLRESNTTSAKNLTLLPDAAISYLPFGLLLTEMPTDKNNYANYPYLIKDYEIGYHYSFNLLNLNQDKVVNQAQSKTAFLGFAPGFNQLENPLLATRSATDRELATSLGNLPGALEEVQQIADFMGGDYLSGANATEAAFKRQASNANILHLATHTLIDNENPLYSKLVFNQGENEQEDGLLYTYELFNMDLQAQMVCLSACNTGTGKYYKGDGMVSLGSGFMYAGVPNVMMTAWAVSDASTATIMQKFYKALDDGKAKSTALREAQLAYLQQADENLAHPYYWGAFMMIGNPEKETNNLIHWIFLGITVLGLFGLIFRKRFFS